MDINAFNSLPNDIEKWKYVIENQDDKTIVLLDNDNTLITNEAGDIGRFSQYIGNSCGIGALLVAVGISAENV
jgi:hypothetical protein